MCPRDLFATYLTLYRRHRRFLRETLTISDAQDLKRLTACALVLLAHIYLTVGNSEVRVDVRSCLFRVSLTAVRSLSVRRA